MRNKINTITSMLMLAIVACPFISNAEDISDPQFSDYQTMVGKGPFAKKIIIGSREKSFSSNWQKKVQEELKKPVNFAGHYRLYTTFGGQGIECSKEGWLCGWVIDKNSGKIVSQLPKDERGSNIYASIGDNGTPVGHPFEIDAYKDSTMVIVTGQVIPESKNSNDDPICKTAIFNFINNEFVKLTESPDGCKID